MRALLAALAVSAAYPGAWATFAPRSFFDTFPGAGDSRKRATGIGASASRSIGKPRSAPSLRNIRLACDQVASSTTNARSSPIPFTTSSGASATT